MAFVERNYQEIVDEILNEIVADNRITDINIGSVTRTIVEALSREIALLYSQLNRVYLSAFVDTAEGKSLDFVVSILGLERRTADYAYGKVTFSRTTPAPADITIPAGTIITGPELPNFETIETATLTIGKKEVEVSIRATIPGEKGIKDKKDNFVKRDTLTIMPKPILGIEKVTNESTPELGITAETDNQLRLRAKNTLSGIGKATIEAIRFATMHAEANAVTIHEMPQEIPGEINVIIDCADDKKAQILQAIDTTRPAGIRVNPLFTEKVIIKNMNIRIILEQPDLLNEEKGKIEEEIREKIIKYISGLKPGERVLANKIVTLVLSVSKVHNVIINTIKTVKVIKKDDKIEEIDDTINRVLSNNDIVIGKFEKAELANLSFETAFL